jgi:hypothetical protein
MQSYLSGMPFFMLSRHQVQRPKASPSLSSQILHVTLLCMSRNDLLFRPAHSASSCRTSTQSPVLRMRQLGALAPSGYSTRLWPPSSPPCCSYAMTFEAACHFRPWTRAACGSSRVLYTHDPQQNHSPTRWPRARAIDPAFARRPRSSGGRGEAAP